MTDVAFVVAAYATVIGGLALYVGSIGRRLRDARHTATVLQRQSERSLPMAPIEAAGPATRQPSQDLR